MNLKRVISSSFMMSVLISNIFISTATAVQDMPDGWSMGAVQYALDNKILSPDNEYIRPRDLLTRAEMALGINNIFGAKDKADISEYTDVSQDKWYYDEMAKAVEIGLFSGYGNGLIKPEKNITREEMLAAIYNILELEKGELTHLDKFNDKDEIGEWAKEIVARMAQDNYVAGNLKGNVKPGDPITREEFAQVMKNIFSMYYNKAGTYTDLPDGNIVINVPGVTLKDGEIKGDLIIADGVKTSDVVLDNVIIEGRILARAGETIQLKNGSKVQEKVIVKEAEYPVKVSAQDASVKNISLETEAILDGEFKIVNINSPGEYKISGNIGTILINQTTNLKVPEGKVEKVIITPAAVGTEISGKGEVVEVLVNADNVTILTEGTKVTAGANAHGVKAGTKDVAPGTTETVKKSSSGGGGGGGSGGGGGGTTACSHNWQTEKEATCTTAEKEKCSKCKKTRTGDAALGHDYSIEMTPADCLNTGLSKCSRCEATQVVEVLGHDYSIVIDPVDCLNAGLSKCSRCEEMQTVEALGHDFSVEKSPASCTDGEVKQCSRCTATQTGDPLGHVKGEYVEKTCTTNGYWKCVRYEVCGHTEENLEDVALGHSYNEENVCTKCGQTRAENCEHDWQTIEAGTCTTGTVKTCNKCNTTVTDEAPGHTYNADEICTVCGWSKKGDCTHDYQEISPANCTTYQFLQCTLCEDIIPGESATGHHFVDKLDATCETAKLQVCDNKNCTATQTVGEPLGHAWITIVEPTCTVKEEIFCNNCKNKKILEANGHAWKATLPTCTEDGYSICQTCGERVEGDKAPGHERGDYVSHTCTSSGYWKCLRYDVCGNREENPEDPAAHTMEYTEATCTEAGFNKCSVCQEVEIDENAPALTHDIITTEATCTESGLEKCSRCDYEKVLDPLTHDIITTEATCTEAGLEKCSRGDYEKILDPLGHSWNDYQEPTCTQASSRTCSVCSETEVLELLPHAMEYTGATCEEAGFNKCSVCGKVEIDESAPALTHEKGDYVGHTCTESGYWKCVRYEVCEKKIENLEDPAAHTMEYTGATCEEAGFNKCSVCEKVEIDESAPALTHEKGDYVGHTCTESGYWKCVRYEVCEKKIENLEDPAAHTMEYTGATCEEAGFDKCSVCGEVVVSEEDPAKGHEKGDYVGHTCTESGYWKCVRYEVCEHTEKNPDDPAAHTMIVTKEAKCTEEGLKECDRCDYEEAIEALTHDIITTPATCIDAGLEKCTRGDYEKILDPLGHEWVTTEATCTQDGIKICDRCGLSETLTAAGHTWGEWQEATCETAKLRTCTVEGCGITETEGTANGHSYDATGVCTVCGKSMSQNACTHVWKVTTEATCTTPAIETCKECLSTRDGEAPSGHNWVTETEATCTLAEVEKCDNEGCGERQTGDVPATGHSWTEVAATCTTSAYRTCDCGEREDIGSPLGHIFGEDDICTGCEKSRQDLCSHNSYETLTPATCTSAEVEYCTECVNEQRNGDPALGHDYQLTTVATCASLGEETCSRCGATRNIGKTTGHDWVTTSPATCATAERQTCSRCKKAQTVGKALNHSMATKKDPTCTVAGIKYCTVCGITEVGEAAKGHTYEVTRDPTCTVVGVKTCSVCGTTNSSDNDMKALGHDYTVEIRAATCTLPQKLQCSRCTSTQNGKAALGHTPGEVDTEGTCEMPTTYICSVCGNLFEGDANSGHNWQVTTKQSCTSQEIKTCTKCGATTNGKAALGHSKGTTYVATCQEPAYYICSRSSCNQKVYTGTEYGDHIWATLHEATCTTDEVEYCKVTGCGLTRTGDVLATGHTFKDGVCEICSQPEICTITFDATTNGGEIIEGNETEEVENGSTFTGTLPTATKSGYTFDGWYTAATEGEVFDASTVLTNHLTLYAQFTETVSE